MKSKSQRIYGAEEARAHLPELLERAHRGLCTVITKHGRPYAALVPVDQMPAHRTASLLSLQGTGAGLWGADPKQTVSTLRDEWE